MAARLITDFHLPTPQCFRSCHGPPSCQSNDFLPDVEAAAGPSPPPPPPAESPAVRGPDCLRHNLIKYYSNAQTSDKMQRQSSNGSPSKTKERGIFKRSVSKDSDNKTNVASKGENAKEKMVKNIYRRPISRAKGACLASRSVFGENRRQQFTKSHLNQVWSSDPRDFRSHASPKGSHESDSSDHGLSDVQKPCLFSRGRRSSSVPDVQFVAAPDAHQEDSSDEENGRMLSKSVPQKQTSFKEEVDVILNKDKRKSVPGKAQSSSKNTLEVSNEEGNNGKKTKCATPEYDGSRSPLLRHLYQKSRHLSHECEDQAKEKLSGSLDSSEISKSFCRQLSLDCTKSKPQSPEECKAKPNVMLRSCDFELYDIETASRTSSSSSTSSTRRGLRVMVELEDVFLGNKTTVKALSGGRTLMIVANSSVNASSMTGQKEIVDRIDLPVTIDPFAVKAKTPRSGHLCIEAPVRHQ